MKNKTLQGGLVGQIAVKNFNVMEPEQFWKLSLKRNEGIKFAGETFKNKNLLLLSSDRTSSCILEQSQYMKSKHSTLIIIRNITQIS